MAEDRSGTDALRREPRHRQVETALRARLAAGEPPIGALLPREVDLAAELGVSRSVVRQEWPALDDGAPVDQINPWAAELFRTLRTIEPSANSEQSAYDQWLSLTTSREEARRDRLHAADGIVPLPVWLVLFFTAVLILVYVLFFADSGEAASAQAIMAGSVAAIVVASLLVLVALNRPYESSIGGLRPGAMERTLAIVDEARAELDVDDAVPCDELGRPA